jgi:hypothetical protein
VDHLGLDGFAECIAVRVLAYEAGVEDVGSFRRESGDAAEGADGRSRDVGVLVLDHWSTSSQGKRQNRRSGARRSASFGRAMLPPWVIRAG